MVGIEACPAVRAWATTVAVLAWMAAAESSAWGQASEAIPPASSAEARPASDVAERPTPPLPAPEGAQRLPEPDQVWIDRDNQSVLVDGYVSLRRGYLEMFACLEGTKEHESVVAVQSRAATVHAALLAVGAVQGRPVQYRPEFAPPTGSVIAVEVRWLDDQGQWQSARAQDWVQDVRTKEPMSQSWVFAGSGFWTDEATGNQFYMAEQGDFICVSNFTSATLDVPIESSQANDGLLFEARTAAIPDLGTRVRLVLTPQLEATEQGEASAAATTTDDESATEAGNE
ncbi:MAG TPA: YdjY domain-containing protein [Lacipirellulaceae bacterium]|nr:YdjY domain-containing protein [Lacipirellulaceae bacterium]HMP06535.1 YdjY domain-containing protein [Lacipirellulaceae bacterium]